MPQRLGRYTLDLTSRPRIISSAAVVGKKEGEGPLAKYFDKINDDTSLGEASWEKAESSLQKAAAQTALDKAGLAPSDIDYIFAGDLLNQCIGSTYGLRDLQIPFIGLFGACSTMALSLATAGTFVDGGAAGKAVAITSSHFCSAERQFRTPLEYGGQRTPTSQWTVTGSGAAIVGAGDSGVAINKITIGKIVDLGIKDANNMGAAMAPSAADTLITYFKDTGTSPNDYDLILTGDLGKVGSGLLHELLKAEGINLGKKHNDCGMMIYDFETQDINAGASGCGCAGSVLCGYIMDKMTSGQLSNILFMATGALMSTTSSQQGESIPGVSHLINLTSE